MDVTFNCLTINQKEKRLSKTFINVHKNEKI